jgi:hypothetical protein
MKRRITCRKTETDRKAWLSDNLHRIKTTQKKGEKDKSSFVTDRISIDVRMDEVLKME